METNKKQVATTKVAAKSDELRELERRYNIPMENNGLERLQSVYTIDIDKEGMRQELYEMVIVPITAFIGGAIYGGLPAARHARGRYIEVSNTEVYEHRIQAVRSAQNAGSRGFIRYGFRWGWRSAVLGGAFHILSTNLAIYRNKDDLLNYAVASATMGALYRFNLGLKGMVGGAFAGTLVGIPAGVFMLGFQVLKGEYNLERYRRKRFEYAKEHWQDIQMRKSMTPMMLDYMETELKKKNLLKSNDDQENL
ncbi:complex I assembly factor TIMMDC1, mitochondrial-like [Antedon mediterranea]|uniref:complex I assembly factor TIMMDC1, mitochondrial-like n=1 Tax=Antedon mediterranea TaxID=105859 RepID=UPI003AF55067